MEFNINEELLKNRIIKLNTEFEPQMANYITSAMQVLDAKSKEPIHLYICSPGGQINSALQILDTMNMLESPIYTYVIGEAASCASFIACMGDKRFISENSTMLFHEPLRMFGDYMTLTEVKRAHNNLDKVAEKMLKLIVANSKISKDELKEKYKEHIDWSIDAKECVKYGFVDEILKTKKKQSKR